MKLMLLGNVPLAETERPTMLVLTRQNLPVLDGTAENAEAGVNKGAYIISEAKGDLDGIIIATGSEVKLALDTQAALEAEGCMFVLFQCHHKISLMNKMPP